MKRMLVLAVAFVATTIATLSQTTNTNQPEILPYGTPGDRALGDTSTPSTSASAAEQGYVWFQPTYPFSDENRQNLYIPTRLGTSGTEFRGAGQIFAPSVFYSYFNNSPYNESSNTYFDGSQGLTDQDYIDQFKDAGSYLVDSVRLWFFKNPYVQMAYPIKLLVLRLTTDLNSASYKQNGLYRVARSSFGIVDTVTITPEAMENTVAENSTGDGYVVVPMTIPFANPLTGSKGQAMIFIYANDAAPATYAVTRLADTNTREFQGIFSAWGYRSGTALAPVDSLLMYQSLGVVLYRIGGSDVISSTWRDLIYTFNQSGSPQRRARLDMRMTFWGSVDLQSGVRYHFGTDASQQGLGAVAPNPATRDARLPFTLTRLAQVTIDLFDMKGRIVSHLVDGRYVPGSYSVALPVDELPSGAYLARMSIGDQVYTTTVAVNK